MRQGIKGPDEPGGSAGLGSGPFGGPNQQISFLQQDLASVDRAVTRKFRGNLLKFFFTWNLATHHHHHRPVHVSRSLARCWRTSTVSFAHPVFDMVLREPYV